MVDFIAPLTTVVLFIIFFIWICFFCAKRQNDIRVNTDENNPSNSNNQNENQGLNMNNFIRQSTRDSILEYDAPYVFFVNEYKSDDKKDEQLPTYEECIKSYNVITSL